MKEIKIQTISNDFFSEYGQIIALSRTGSNVPTLESEFFQFFGGLAYMEVGRPVEFGICTFKKRGLIANQLEQHGKTPELLFAIDGDFIMPVTSICNKNGENIPEEDKLIAIRVPAGKGLIFHQGIWHWAPYPIKDSSSVLVGFERDTAQNDLVITDLKEQIRMIE